MTLLAVIHPLHFRFLSANSQSKAEKTKFNRAEVISLGAISFRLDAISFRFDAIKFQLDAIKFDFGAIKFAAKALRFPFVGPRFSATTDEIFAKASPFGSTRLDEPPFLLKGEYSSLAAGASLEESGMSPDYHFSRCDSWRQIIWAARWGAPASPSRRAISS